MKFRDEVKALIQEVGNGNIFAQAGLSNPEIRLAKAQMEDVIRQQTEDMTVAGAARESGLIVMNVIDNIRAGQTSGLSLKRLVTALKRLGNDVEISVKVTKRAQRP